MHTSICKHGKCPPPPIPKMYNYVWFLFFFSLTGAEKFETSNWPTAPNCQSWRIPLDCPECAHNVMSVISIIILSMPTEAQKLYLTSWPSQLSLSHTHHKVSVHTCTVCYMPVNWAIPSQVFINNWHYKQATETVENFELHVFSFTVGNKRKNNFFH